MTNPNRNPACRKDFTARRGLFDQRRLRSRRRELATTTATSEQKRRPTTYFEFLWSLPARKTLPELLRTSC